MLTFVGAETISEPKSCFAILTSAVLIDWFGPLIIVCLVEEPGGLNERGGEKVYRLASSYTPAGESTFNEMIISISLLHSHEHTLPLSLSLSLTHTQDLCRFIVKQCTSIDRYEDPYNYFSL